MWNPLRRRLSAGRITTAETGTAGEDAAAALLENAGFRILERNYRCRLGEVDIIAMDGDCLCFVEVKTRRSERCGTPAEAVTFRKRAQIMKASQHYLAFRGNHTGDCRFDVVSVAASTDGAYSATLTRDAFRE